MKTLWKLYCWLSWRSKGIIKKVWFVFKGFCIDIWDDQFGGLIVATACIIAIIIAMALDHYYS